MLLAMSRANARVNIFNLGTDTYCQVNESIAWISAAMEVAPQVIYTGGDRGWTGDSPFIFLDTRRIRALGWQPKLSIRDGILKTVAFLHDHDWLLAARA
jgi:UDP-glucose 4-epimerase